MNPNLQAGEGMSALAQRAEEGTGAGSALERGAGAS